MWPVDLHFPIIGKTVAQVQVNETLIWNAGFVGHSLEIIHNILLKAHRHRLLQLGGVRILAGLQFGKVVFSSHVCPPR